jgi:hypothetical protein
VQAEQETNELDLMCQQVWGAYEYLRDHDLSEKSGTSKRLRAGDLNKLRARLAEELLELRGVVEGTHFHEGFDKDIILEGYEVIYWAICLAVAARRQYSAIHPDIYLIIGYRGGKVNKDELLTNFKEVAGAILKDSGLGGIIPLISFIFMLVGKACTLNDTSPARLLERDISEMQQKDYLAEYWNNLK